MAGRPSRGGIGATLGLLASLAVACGGTGSDTPEGSDSGGVAFDAGSDDGRADTGADAMSDGRADGPDAPHDAVGDTRAADAADATDATDASSDGATDVCSDAVWMPLTALGVVDPTDHGAVGDGVADDLPALRAAVAALPPAGGIVFFPKGKSFRKSDVWSIDAAHVKVWAPNQQAELFGTPLGVARRQATICRQPGCGFFGVKLRSDASARFDALEDNQIAIDHTTDAEIVGVEVQGSAAAGLFLYGSTRTFIQGSYVHHTWADHIHHTAAARESWVWRNWIFNEAPSNGDDGVACVTYGETSPTCGDMEWWRNTILHTGWGRGYSVIGGDAIDVHDNWAIGVAGAGVIVASEPSYGSGSSHDVTAEDNHLLGCGHAIGHPGILVSGMNSAAAPLRSIHFTSNVVVDTVLSKTAFGEEGAYVDVTNVGMSTAASDLPAPTPTVADVKLEDTSVLRTRDVSFVADAERRGLQRIHVGRCGDAYRQRFEYVVRGPVDAVSTFVAGLGAHARLIEARDVGGARVALVLSGAPLVVPAALEGLSFRDLRAGDRDGSLSWLWSRLELGGE